MQLNEFLLGYLQLYIFLILRTSPVDRYSRCPIELVYLESFGSTVAFPFNENAGKSLIIS